jgi:hypothetical protein
VAELDPFDAALEEAQAACAKGRTIGIVESAQRLAEIGTSTGASEASLAAAELYALVLDFRSADAAIEQAKKSLAGHAHRMAEYRSIGLKVLESLGDEIAALALRAGQVNARHSQAQTDAERRELERTMNAMEVRLEAAGLEGIQTVLGGFHVVLDTFWGAHYAALFRLALALESLAANLFPNVERSDIANTVRMSLDVSLPLVRLVAGRDISARLREATDAEATPDAIGRVRDAGVEVLRAAKDRAGV